MCVSPVWIDLLPPSVEWAATEVDGEVECNNEPGDKCNRCIEDVNEAFPNNASGHALVKEEHADLEKPNTPNI